MDLGLKGKVALVKRAGSQTGFGRAIAVTLAREGCDLIIADINLQNAKRTAGEIKNLDYKAIAVKVDITDSQAVKNMFKLALDKFGKIDILVNSAGVIQRGPVEDFTEEQWDYIMNINLKGLFFCCQLVGQEMIKRKKGKIINISSNVSEVIQSLRVVYAVSKAGVSHLTRGLALEWAKYNINVNAIGPGPTITELNKTYFEENPDDLQERIDSIPMARVGYPPDHVGAAIYLASEASNYVTGQTLLVDGGSTIW